MNFDFWPYNTALWDKISRTVAPESHAESIVNQIYGQEDRMPDVPAIMETYEPGYSDFPQVIARPIVSGTRYVQTTISGMGESLTKYAIIAAAVILAGLFLYGFLPALGRKFGAR